MTLSKQDDISVWQRKQKLNSEAKADQVFLAKAGEL